MSEFASIPRPPEDHEELLASGLVVFLQFHKENALALQHDQLEAHHKARQPLRAANYVIESRNEDGQHIPAKHTRVVFGPQAQQPFRHRVAQIVARYPETKDDYYPEHNLGLPWNDVFLEVWTVDGNSQDYLLNSKGLVAFNDAQQDVISDDDCRQTSDLFTVPSDAKFKSSIVLEKLNDLLRLDTLSYDSYVYQLQSNEEEVPYVPEGYGPHLTE